MPRDDIPRGLPGHPPRGEEILWQGAPGIWALARHVFRIRWVAGYFLVLGGWRAATIGSEMGLAYGLNVGSWYASMAAVTLGILVAMAWAMARTTVYTITTKRVALRTGVALNVTLNIPYRMLDSADLKTNGDGTGDVYLTMKGDNRVSYLVMWPHVRPWRFVTRPALRALPEVATVARLLGATAEARLAELETHAFAAE